MDLNAPNSMGTIIGVTYEGGVVLGADSRSCTGMYVANRAKDKITQLTDNVAACTVKVAANLVSKNMLQTGGLIIVGGWDKYEGGKIYGVGRLGGSGTVVIEQPFAIGGSGSSYLYGFFDQAWKQGMTEQEAEQLIVKALSLAIARDGATGGIVRTVTINSQGVSRNFYPVDTDLEAHTSLLDIWS
ncbi:hypothetical protein LWI29_011243 [Acer saccharum]|uniref:Proteasome endopeptidase complex n=1 Tax=Acer saccharum TaxID=4024 RepID=A0AA39SSL9_ACESA|nr:hypothetical protein LWI29_011243 [Acer saccharum]